MYKAAHISRFNIEYLAWRLDNVVDSILPSVKTHGFLSPITCIEFNNERYIVDGLTGKALSGSKGVRHCRTSLYCYFSGYCYCGCD